jgi:cytochrome P450
LAELSLLQLLKPEHLENPHGLYTRLRECEPVHWDPFVNAWIVTSYAETVAVLTRFNAARTPTPERMARMGLDVLSPYAAMMLQQILFMDAPDHTRLRSLCAIAFTPKRVAALRDSIQQIAERLLDHISSLGRCDLVADFAAPFPSLVLTALLGLPQEDAPQLRRWARDLGELAGNFEQDPERLPQLATSLAELDRYIRAEVTRQLTSPVDGFISTLLAANVDGASASFDEVVANTILIIGAGLEETANLIANGTLSLLQHPEALAQLREDPEIIQPAVEELLRFESTTQYTGRVAQEDTILGGQSIRKGDAITVVLAAANRDPARFPFPDQLDLARADNRHVAFSWAGHYCLGAPLARMTAQIAFSSVLRRLSGLSLAEARPNWRRMAAMRALQSLPVQFTPHHPDHEQDRCLPH